MISGFISLSDFQLFFILLISSVVMILIINGSAGKFSVNDLPIGDGKCSVHAFGSAVKGGVQKPGCGINAFYRYFTIGKRIAVEHFFVIGLVIAVGGATFTGKWLQFISAGRPAIDVKGNGPFFPVHVAGNVQLYALAHVKAADVPTRCLHLFPIHFKNNLVVC